MFTTKNNLAGSNFFPGVDTTMEEIIDVSLTQRHYKC